MGERVDGLLAGIDDFLYGLNKMAGQPASHYCRLESGIGNVLIADDGSLLSMIEVAGNLNYRDEEEFTAMLNRLYLSMAPLFKSPGQVLQVVFHYDPEASVDEANYALDPARKTAQAFGVNADMLFDDWVKTISKYTSAERCWLVLWTREFLLPKATRKAVRASATKASIKASRVGDGQNPNRALTGLLERHRGAVNGLVDAMDSAKLMAHTLSAEDALWWVRHCTDKTITSRNWRVRLSTNGASVRVPDRGAAKGRYPHLVYPKVKYQVIPRDAERLSDTVIRIGDYLHAPAVISLPPEDPRAFNALFASLIKKPFPWRISFLIEGGGLSGLGIKEALASIFYVFSDANKKFKKALKELNAYDLDGGTTVRWRVTLDTWTNAHNPNAIKTVHEQISDLMQAVQGWGTCDTTNVIGAPLLGVSASLPAFMANSPAPVAAAPLEDAIKMLPLTRPAAPWKQASLLLRSRDGKLIPQSLFSSLQAAWIEIGVASMGKGKSTQLNTVNFAFIFSPGLSELPYLAMTDIGPSSSGVITALQAKLPKSQRHLAMYARLRMDPDKYAINPCDLQLGFSSPLPSHRGFLVNFFSLICTELGERSPPSGVTGLLMAAIDAAYQQFHPDRNPKPYRPNLDPSVDEVVHGLALHLDNKTSWFEIADALFKAGYRHEAARAQRYAVPLPGEIAMFVKMAQVAQRYDFDAPSGEKLPDYVSRCILEAIQAYPILKNPTRFDIGEARIIALDLDEVAPRGSAAADRQSAVMFMLSRHVTASHFFLHEDDAEQARPSYKEFQRDRIKMIRRLPKRMCFDEVHRFTKNEAIVSQVVADLEPAARESRKWNLGIALYSQEIDDIPEVITELATTIYIMGANTVQMADNLAKRFGLNNAAKNFILNIGTPGARGAELLMIARLTNGVLVQPVANTIGPFMRTAFETRSEDSIIRNALYKRFTADDVMRYLSERYPSGLKPEVERRKLARSATDVEDLRVDILDEIIEESSVEMAKMGAAPAD